MQHTILIVDDDKENLKFMKTLLESSGYAVHQAPSAQFATSLLHKNKGRYSLAIVDYHMPHIMGDEATRIFREIDSDLQVITISGDDSDEAFDRNLKAGAFLFLSRTISTARLLSIVENYCKKSEGRNASLAPQVAPSEAETYIGSFEMVGRSEHLVEICAMIERYAKTDESILIRGENGTGKERVARAIHKHSAVAEGPFVCVNCGAINEHLIESELFGHVKGSFTGATKDRLGYFREADGGTIFLDEIGDMPRSLQVKLLRVLQEREIIPVGETRPIKIDVRIIAATNVNLEKAVRDGKFREDLFYRLNVLPIELKPLRERPDDIDPLLQLFERRWQEKSGEQKTFRKDVVSIFHSHAWPGNIRELQNVASRLLVSADGPEVTPKHLNEALKKKKDSPKTKSLTERYHSIRVRSQQEEREVLIEIVKEAGTLTRAAKVMQIAKSTLHDRLKALGINLSQLTEEKS